MTADPHRPPATSTKPGPAARDGSGLTLARLVLGVVSVIAWITLSILANWPQC